MVDGWYGSSVAFQLTLPVWGATFGKDWRPASGKFQLTLPVWERQHTHATVPPKTAFQLTLPVWGATLTLRALAQAFTISTHAPRVGSDPVSALIDHHRNHFNSRSPCGERPHPAWRFGEYADFNSRSPCGERRKAAQATPRS